MTFDGNNMALGGANRVAGGRQLPSFAAPKTDSVAEAFLNEAKKSPIERMREAILKQHNLTEEQFEALPGDQREAIQREVEEALKQKMKAQPCAAATGMNANVLA